MSFEVREAVRKERRGIFRVVSTEFLIISHPPKIAENIVIRLHTAEQEGSAVAAQMRSATPLHQILSQQQMVSSFHCNTSHYCAACGFTRRGLSRTIRKAITASRFVNKPKIIQRDLFMPSFTALL